MNNLKYSSSLMPLICDYVEGSRCTYIQLRSYLEALQFLPPVIRNAGTNELRIQFLIRPKKLFGDLIISPHPLTRIFLRQKYIHMLWMVRLGRGHDVFFSVADRKQNSCGPAQWNQVFVVIFIWYCLWKRSQETGLQNK